MNLDQKQLDDNKNQLSQFFISFNNLLLFKGSEVVNKDKAAEEMKSFRSSIDMAK
jgi:hypothetical protein